VLERYHRRARTKRPWLQGIAFVVLAPLLMLLARVRIHGREHIPDGGFILAANHPSQLDAFFVAIALGRRVRFMGKSELFKGPAGRWMARMGAFPIQRGVWDADAFETSAPVLAQGKVLCMFYEGGLSPAEGGYRVAKPGIGHIAQLAGATVLPCHLTGTRRLYRPWTWPKITVTYGAPLTVEPVAAPSRESNAAVARTIADAVEALA
jgi:1-acyl-sn-glycerol-3-phosphate acyltransferase